MKAWLVLPFLAALNFSTAAAGSAAVRVEQGYASFDMQNMTTSAAGKIVGLQELEGGMSRVTLVATPLEHRLFSLSLSVGVTGAFANSAASNDTTSLKAELFSLSAYVSALPAFYFGTWSFGLGPGMQIGAWNELHMSVTDKGVSGSSKSSLDVNESLLTLRINKDTSAAMTFGVFGELALGRLKIENTSKTHDFRCFFVGANFEYRFVEPNIILTLSRGKSLGSMK